MQHDYQDCVHLGCSPNSVRRMGGTSHKTKAGGQKVCDVAIDAVGVEAVG